MRKSDRRNGRAILLTWTAQWQNHLRKGRSEPEIAMVLDVYNSFGFVHAACGMRFLSLGDISEPKGATGITLNITIFYFKTTAKRTLNCIHLFLVFGGA